MEEIKKIEVQGQQYGVADMLMRSVMGGNAQVIEWSHTHNMNDYKDAGTYRIKGERTGNPLDDNLPIMNSGGGNTIDGVFTVFDSSITRTEGEAKNDDCTVTQFLMLSNRVGGQEGDMYMRSAYGANKDSLLWKPWEKYQTNMEVGAMTDVFTLNPLNPTQVIGRVGMKHLTDNGMYSGVYVPPKVYAGTSYTPTIEINDPTAIETFVMVVINNYVAASNARCVTQIKFAVTNGGVFSMEKRSTTPGTTDGWSQWKTAGGGLGSWDVAGRDFTIENPVNPSKPSTLGNNVFIGSNTKIYNSVSIASDVRIGKSVDLLPLLIYYGDDNLIIGTNSVDASKDNITVIHHGAKIKKCSIGEDVILENGVTIKNNLLIDSGNYKKLYIGTAMDNSPSTDEVTLGGGTYIGKNVNIGENVNIKESQISTKESIYTINMYKNSSNIEGEISMYGHGFTSSYTEHLDNLDETTGLTVRGAEGVEFISKCNREYKDGTYSLKNNTLTVSDTSLKVIHSEETQDDDFAIVTEIAHGIAITPSEDGSKLLLSYNGKTAELQLT